jgi:hypothetical protein
MKPEQALAKKARVDFLKLIPILHQSELTIHGKQVMERTSVEFRPM